MNQFVSFNSVQLHFVCFPQENLHTLCLFVYFFCPEDPTQTNVNVLCVRLFSIIEAVTLATAGEDCDGNFDLRGLKE